MSAETIAIILASASALTSVITACFGAMSMSRCSSIRCCGGECVRSVLSAEEVEHMQRKLRDDG